MTRTSFAVAAVALVNGIAALSAAPAAAQVTITPVVPVFPQLPPLRPAVFCGARVTNNNDSGAGSLRAAVATPPAFGAICFDTTVFNANAAVANRTIVVTTPIVLAVNVRVEGPGVDVVRVSGGGASSVFTVASGTRATLGTLTIHGGNSQWGAGIYNAGTLFLDRVTMRDNTGRAGAAVYNAGTMTATDTIFANNTAEWNGGAIYDYYGGTLTLRRCTLNNNRADISGGAIAKVDGDMLLEDTVVRDNVGASAGGVFNRSGASRMVRSRVENNTAQTSTGGGIVNTAYGVTTLTLEDTQVTGNSAATTGGGVYNQGGAQLILQGSSAVTGNAPNDII
jgi:predicted outer membrane repeat protein